jgi:tRNA(Ile)-lysidine synthase
MHRVADSVRRTIIRFNLIPPGCRVVAAVSGGSDSVALVRLLADLAGPLEFRLAAIAHLHHGLRGRSADEDEAFCRDLAASLGLAFDGERADVRALMAAERCSAEDAGRRARYAFLARAAARAGADRVAVGHTRDDQAETLLMHLFRGAGLRGLAGIHPRAGLVVRPLIGERREDLRGFLRARGLEWREDETNRDPAMLRNRVRHELIPYLERRFSPGLVDALSRDAALARADADCLDALAAEERKHLTPAGPDGGRAVTLPIAALRSEPEALGSRLTRQILLEVSGGRFMGYEHVRSVVDLAASGADAACLRLPGVVVTRAGPVLRFEPARPRQGAAGARHGGVANRAEANSLRVSLSIPGEAVIQATGDAVTAEEASWPASGLRLIDGRLDLPPEVAVVDRALVPGALAVRFRRPGDRLRPLGLEGRKKLHDFFVDRKVARAERDRVPLVVGAADDRIVWVAGHRIAEEFRVTGRTEGVVILKLKHWSDRA